MFVARGGAQFESVSMFARTDSALGHDGLVINPIAPVVPPGRMKQTRQPDFALPRGMHLRPWRQSDARVLVQSCLDPDIQHWNRPGQLTIDALGRQLLREAHGELDAGGPRPFAAFLDVSGIWAPTAAFTAAEAHMPSATQQFAALAEQTAARLVRGRGQGAVAGAVRVVRGRCRALR